MLCTQKSLEGKFRTNQPRSGEQGKRLRPGRLHRTTVVRVQRRSRPDPRYTHDQLRHMLEQARCLLWEADLRESAPVSGQPLPDDSCPMEIEWDLRVVNRSASDVADWLPFAREPGESLTDAWLRSRVDDDRAAADLMVRDALRRGLPRYTQTFRHKMADGTIRWLQEDVRIEVRRPNAYSGKGGTDQRSWYLTGLVTDITARKLAEQESEAARLQLYQILGQANCLVWWADVQEIVGDPEGEASFDPVRGTIIRWVSMQLVDEEEAFRWLPIERQPGEGFIESWAYARHPDDFNECNVRCANALVTGATGFVQTFRTTMADGSIRWLHEDIRIERQDSQTQVCQTGEPLRRWRVTGVATDITERKRAEEAQRQTAEALRHQQVFLRNVLDASINSIFVVDADGFYTMANRAHAETVGTTVENLVGQSFVSFVNDKDTIRRLQASHDLALAHPQEVFVAEERIVTPVGPRWLQTMKRAIPSLNGERNEVLVIFTDITERVRAEQEREAARLQLYQTMAQANCLLWWADVRETNVAPGETARLDAARGTSVDWTRMYVVDEEEAFRWMQIDRRKNEDFFFAWNRARHTEDFRECRERSANALASGSGGYTQTFRTTTADGSLRWLHEEVRIEQRPPQMEVCQTGEPLRYWHITGVVTDITELKRAEQAVEDARAELRQVMGQANCLLWQATVREVFPGEFPHMPFDEERGTHLLWQLNIINQSETETPSWLPRFQEPGESVGEALHRSRLSSEETEGEDIAREALLKGNPRYVQQFRLRMTDGTICWMSEDVRIMELPPCVPGKDENVDPAFQSMDGRPLRRWQLTGVITDIHEQKLIEDRQHALTEQLRRTNASLREFAYVASHDLKEPLRKIQSFGNLLRRKVGPSLNAEANEYIDRMTCAAERMQALVQSLLAYSTIAGKVQEMRPVDLSEIVAACLNDLEQRIEEVGATIDVGPLPTIPADGLQMGQLFQNLISNALKYRRPEVPCYIRVAAEEDGDHITLRFIDNGIGFAPEHAERIFQIFERLEGRGNVEGSGVGLSICRKIVERHGGTIVAEGSPNAGATFTVRLPRHPLILPV